MGGVTRQVQPTTQCVHSLWRPGRCLQIDFKAPSPDVWHLLISVGMPLKAESGRGMGIFSASIQNPASHCLCLTFDLLMLQ